MSYFDHVRCSSCGARINPEHVGRHTRRMECPSCGAQLQVADLFGVADPWAEDDVPDLTLEDAVPGAIPSSTPDPWSSRRADPDYSQPIGEERMITDQSKGGKRSALDVMKDLKKGR